MDVLSHVMCVCFFYYKPVLNGDESIVVRVVRGSIASEVHALLPVVEQTIRLTDSPGNYTRALLSLRLLADQPSDRYSRLLTAGKYLKKQQVPVGLFWIITLHSIK